MKLRLFQIVAAHLNESPDSAIAGETLRSELATLLPYDQPSKLFATLVAWGRYAEILDYDENADMITRQPSDTESGATSDTDD
jgi:NitT/TauT family transport system ATP-binding protein